MTAESNEALMTLVHLINSLLNTREELRISKA